MEDREIRGLRRDLGEYLESFADCFGRRDTREHLATYVVGQLSEITRKSVEPIALRAGVPPRTLQNFLSLLKWDHDRLRDRVAEIVAAEHAHRCSVGIVDETSDDKKGRMTPGVKRQWCGSQGKVDNCVVTVHLGYATPDFRCLLDGDLFLPEDWADDRERCRAAGIPDDVGHREKWRIALDLYDRAVANGVSFRWLTFDEGYGLREYLRGLEERGQDYVGEVRPTLAGWTRAPEVTDRPYRGRGRRGAVRRARRVRFDQPPPRPLRELLEHDPALRDQPWTRYRVEDGEKGPMVWEVKEVPLHLVENRLPGPRRRLIVARNPLNVEGTVKYFVSNDLETPLGTLLLVAFSRWKVERCFQDDKGEIGLDHYEGRTYTGLIRHLALSAVSLLFLARVHARMRGGKSGADDPPGAHGLLRRGPLLVA
jgi:SRSO17 transposase